MKGTHKLSPGIVQSGSVRFQAKDSPRDSQSVTENMGEKHIYGTML